MVKRACVISGGGSWGAYGGGTLARINGDYDTIVGVSTGSLLAPLVGLKEWVLLKEVFTNVDCDDIFDKCWLKGSPITKKGKIRKLPIVLTLLLGNKSVYTSKALRKTIDKFFSKENYDELYRQEKEILVGTQNFAEIPSKVHYFTSRNQSFADFKDWMWCSANFPFFSSLVKKGWRDQNDKFHVGTWSDGGLTDLVGIDQLIKGDYDEIDVILHRRKSDNRFEGNKINTLMDNVTISINAMRYDIEFDYFYDEIKRLNRKGVKVRVFWLPRKLSNNSLMFNKKEMADWWDEGYETAFSCERMEVFESTKKSF